MKILKGIPVSAGVVIGRLSVLREVGEPGAIRRLIPANKVDDEVARFNAARAASIAELEVVHQRSVEEMGPEAAKIFLFHIGALSDRSLIEPVQQRIRDERVNAEYAVWAVIEDWVERFRRRSDSAFHTKISDLEDLSRRVIRNLLGGERGAERAGSGAGAGAEASEAGGAVGDEPTVIAARDLTPSQTAGFDRSRVLAFVTDLGGPTSHTAIVARALGLPAVVGCQRMTASAEDGCRVIVDGGTGTVILNPDDKTVEQYAGEVHRQHLFRMSLREVANLPAETVDGVEVELVGNIEFPEEAAGVLENGGSGVGLYRTEFLYLTSRTEPTEQEHFAAYRRCLELLGGRKLTIRTVDLGADKYTQERAAVPERNPFLGLRSIRYCLQNLGMFKTQLRAILRASAFGPLEIMFPLITSPSEFRQARHVLLDAMEDLEELGVEFDRSVPVGMMMEVPSAAVMAETFAREVDFFSIGTNDLVQYTLAVDRTNERVANLYQPAHPAVVSLIRGIVRAASGRGIGVSCCGEAAADPGYALLLLGLGVRTLSVSSTSLPELKRVIRAVSMEECERIAERVMGLDSELEAASYLRERVRRLVPEAFSGRMDA